MSWHLKEGRLYQNYRGIELTWMMTNEYEVAAHSELKEKAKGDVLLAGLGIGYANKLIAEQVNSIVVVEKEREVIDLYPNKDPKTEIVHDRILHYLQITERMFDVIFLDIFPNEPMYFPREVAILTEHAQARLKPNGDILFWHLYPLLEL